MSGFFRNFAADFRCRFTECSLERSLCKNTPLSGKRFNQGNVFHLRRTILDFKPKEPD